MSHPAFENQNGHSAAYLAELAREFHEAPDAAEPYFRGPEVEFDDWDENLSVFVRPQAGKSVKFNHHTCGDAPRCDCDLQMLEAIDPDWTDHYGHREVGDVLREYRDSMKDAEWNKIFDDLNS